MRHTFLVAYDVSDAKRLRKVHQAVREYGDRLQFSVYRCSLSPKERVLLSARLKGLVNEKEDRVLLVNLGPTGNASVETETIGVPCQEEEHGTIVL